MKKSTEDEPVTARLPTSIIEWLDALRIDAAKKEKGIPSRSDILRRVLLDAKSRHEAKGGNPKKGKA